MYIVEKNKYIYNKGGVVNDTNIDNSALQQPIRKVDKSESQQVHTDLSGRRNEARGQEQNLRSARYR